MEDNSFLDSNGDEEIGSEKDQKVESAKGESREENKMLEFFDILQQDKPEDDTNAKGSFGHDEENEEESELVSLSLGRSSISEDIVDKGLALGLDINLDPVDQDEASNNLSTESSFGQGGNEEEPTKMWPPSKVLKTMESRDKSEASQQHDQKKARVSIRARCDAQTMNDGCQWRKYGQKMAKGNPCPRAYYRCTVSSSCPVRKQVQRCAEDMSILITTYEGTHNHPLPMSATAMACTTSAAASMLQSPSLTSQHGLVNSAISSIINSWAPNYNPNNNALNFSLYQVSRPHQQFYFPNPSISTFNSHPTITLDLTTPPTSSNTTFSHMPKYSSTSLNFSTGFSPLQSSMPQSPWISSYNGYFNTGTLTQNTNHSDNYLLNTRNIQPSLGHLHQPIYASNNNTTISQQSFPDPIVAATKAITSNPKFQSALATALTTYVGNEGGGDRLRENYVLESAELNLKLCSKNNIACASSRYMNMSSSPQGNSSVFPLSLTVSKIASGLCSNSSNQLLEKWK